MPIEIKELHIRVAVNAPQSEQKTNSRADSNNREGSDDNKEAIVTECVEQILQILQHKLER
jgi:hypothetical protein